jgi:hypothetical protein
MHPETNLPSWFNAIFAAVALLASAFYGLKAFDAFEVSAREKPWAWCVHQVWFNFLGAAIGWVALWFVVHDVWRAAALGQARVTLSGALLGVLAFVGATGHLPLALSGVLQGVKELALKALGLLKS